MYKGICRAENVPRGRSPLCFRCQAGLEGTDQNLFAVLLFV